MYPYCQGKSSRFGKSSTGNQRYRCEQCKKTYSCLYVYAACQPGTDDPIKDHLKEGCGIRSIARLLKISSTTVLSRIIKIAAYTLRPFTCLCKEYELDEMCTYVKQKNNLKWIVYALRKDTREIADFAVGNRTNATLKKVTDTLVFSYAKHVYTDKLPQYARLFPENVHITQQYGTNHIERNNLSVRTHLKRLSRRTICFSKSINVLTACLKIYF